MSTTSLRTLLGRAIPALSAMYRAECDEATLEVWHMALEGEDVATVQTVLRRFLREPGRRWMPTTNEVVEAMHGSPEDDAVMAWPKALEAIQFGRPSGDQRIDAALRALGGIRSLGELHTDQRPHTRHAFLKAYMATTRTEKREELPRLDLGAIGRIACD